MGAGGETAERVECRDRRAASGFQWCGRSSRRGVAGGLAAAPARACAPCGWCCTAARGRRRADGECSCRPDGGPARPALLTVFLHDGRERTSFRKHGLADLAAGMVQGGAISHGHREPASRRHSSSTARAAAMEASSPTTSSRTWNAGFRASRPPHAPVGVGDSMGYGALRGSLRRPEVFGRAAALARRSSRWPRTPTIEPAPR